MRLGARREICCMIGLRVVSCVSFDVQQDDSHVERGSVERRGRGLRRHRLITRILRNLKMLTNFKIKIRYRERLQIGWKSLIQTYFVQLWSLEEQHCDVSRANICLLA